MLKMQLGQMLQILRANQEPDSYYSHFQNFMAYFFSFLLTIISFNAAAHHPKNLTVKSCPCDAACYTGEISNLKCDDRQAQFDSTGMPHKSHVMMKGIKNSNQQFPLKQPYNAANHNQVRINLNPVMAAVPIMTDSGAIGIAVNGVPIFDPSKQDERHDVNGKPAHTLDVGELDECGGHAGRGDDYHYHIAPKCLIEQLGKDKIENQKLPIGYAKDGFSIHALGWFDSANNIENYLDKCRGAFDASGKYFYNVKSQRKWDVLNCYSGEPKELGIRGSILRRDKNGSALAGGDGAKGMIPIKFAVENYYSKTYGNNLCYFSDGELSGENLLLKSGAVIRNYSAHGTIFYCNSKCYSHFFESDKRREGGRVTVNEVITSGCPEGLDVKKLNLFRE